MKNIIALLIAPLGTPVTFAVWNGLAIDPQSFREILFALPRLFRHATPVAYVVMLLLGIPAVLILSRKKCLTLPAIIFVGAFIGFISGLSIGFHIASYDIRGVFDYFTVDFISLYAPSTISGMVSAVIYWLMRTTLSRGKK